MINHQIKNSCDIILPTEEEKQQMLKHILTKKKRGFKKYLFVGIFTSTIAAMYFLIISQTPPPTIEMPMVRTLNIQQIEYRGKCYEYIGVYNKKNLKTTNDEIMGKKVYKIKNKKDSIVIYENGEYNYYQECKGEIK